MKEQQVILGTFQGLLERFLKIHLILYVCLRLVNKGKRVT